MHRSLFHYIPVLTVWTLAKSFSQMLSSKEKLFWLVIRQQYKIMKQFVDLINETTGEYYTFSAASNLIYLAVNLRFKDWNHATVVMIYLISYAVVLYFAGDICYQVTPIFAEKLQLKLIILISKFSVYLAQMEKLKDWLAMEQNREAMHLDEILLTISELKGNRVAIRGWRGYPILTFSLAANVPTIPFQTNIMS